MKKMIWNTGKSVLKKTLIDAPVAGLKNLASIWNQPLLSNTTHDKLHKEIKEK